MRKMVLLFSTLMGRLHQLGLNAVLPSLIRSGKELQVFRAKSGVLADPGQRCWSDLLVVMEGEREVRPTGSRQLAMRTNLLL